MTRVSRLLSEEVKREENWEEKRKEEEEVPGSSEFCWCEEGTMYMMTNVSTIWVYSIVILNRRSTRMNSIEGHSIHGMDNIYKVQWSRVRKLTKEVEDETVATFGGRPALPVDVVNSRPYIIIFESCSNITSMFGWYMSILYSQIVFVKIPGYNLNLYGITLHIDPWKLMQLFSCRKPFKIRLSFFL